MRGISQFIGAVILVVIVITVGGIMILWATGLMKETATGTGEEAQQALECRKGGIRISDDTIRCNFTDTTDYLNFSLENTGYIDMYGFKAYVYSGGITYGYDVFEAVTNKNFTKDYPLKIGEVKTVFVNITDNLSPGKPNWLKIATRCPQVYDRIENITC